MQGNDEPTYGYEEPIPFLEILENEHGDVEFQLSPKSEEYLRRMTNKKVAVLTIAGPQRSGKSFLANRFLKKMAGFAIGPTTNPCTKGIWLWGKPISLNSEVDLLIMDTEGLNSTQRDQTIDMKIFSISILLSSYFMYNSFGHIDENALENLSLVVHLSEHINISSQATSENDYAKYFPYFHWVLRDFSLDLKGRSSNQYLEAALQVVQGADQDKQKKNNIRNKIKNYFKARECTTLVRPLNDESKLAYIEKQRWDELRPEFREDVEYLVNNVLASIGPKIIQGKPLTGEMILNLTKSYLQALNTGGVPQILTSLERVVSSEMKRIYDTLVKEYMSMIESTFHEKALPMPEDELLKKHKEITTHILKKLTTSGEIIGHKEVSMIQQKIALGFEKTLKGKMDMNAEKISALSQKAISNFGSKLPIPHAADLKEGFAEIVPKLVTPFKDTFQQFYQVFKNGLQGSNKKFSIFSDMMPKIIMDYYDKVVQVCEQVKDEEVQDMQKKLEQAREGEAALRQILEDNQSLLSQLKSEKNEIRGEYEKMKEELNEVMDAADREKDRLKFELKKMSITLESAKKEDTGGRSNEADLLEEVEILKEQNKFYKREMDRQKESISALKEALEAARSTAQVTEAVASKPAKNGNKLRDLDGSDDDDIHDSPQVQELYEKIFTLESRIKELEATGLGLTEIDINPNGTQEDVEPEEVLLDDSQIVEDQLLGLCHNEELKGKVKILFTNYNRQKILFQKKLGTLFFENNKLKAEIIDYNKKLESLPKKDELIESLRKEVKSLNASLNGQAGGMSEGSLEFQLAQLKSDSLRISGEKENLLYFMKELILKMKKKKNHHYEHAFSSLPEQDQIDIRNIFNEIGFKP